MTNNRQTLYIREPFRRLLEMLAEINKRSKSAQVEQMIIDASKLQKLPAVKIGDDGKIALVEKRSTRGQKPVKRGGGK